MIFKTHSELKDRHAVLSASKYHWINYDDEKINGYVDRLHAARRGTRLHDLAKNLIELGVKLPNTGQTLNMYVNDCIGYRMKPEQSLFVSDWAFGTADSIEFRDNILRIFDLKNGKNKSSETQLLVYAAYFCIEYKVRPSKIEFDLRIYQNDEVFEIEVDVLDVVYIMERVTEVSSMIATKMQEEV